ncbi:MAG: hypothetical protein RLZZ207_917, partial [Bacteroidota bacterium]
GPSLKILLPLPMVIRVLEIFLCDYPLFGLLSLNIDLEVF